METMEAEKTTETPVEKTRKPIPWIPILTVSSVGIFLLLLVTVIQLSSTVRSFAPQQKQIENILARLDVISEELEALDTAQLVETVNDMTLTLKEAELDETLESIREISSQLEALDWATMSEDLDSAMLQVGDAMETLNAAMDALDVEGITKAVKDLKATVEPIAKFVGLFSKD